MCHNTDEIWQSVPYRYVTTDTRCVCKLHLLLAFYDIVFYSLSSLEALDSSRIVSLIHMCIYRYR